MSRLALPPLAPGYEQQVILRAAVQPRSIGRAERLFAYVELTKPKIASLVLLTVAVGACCAAQGVPPGWLLLHTLLGTALIAASASALNAWLERESDRVMPRTASRPLPAGKLYPGEVFLFGAFAAAGGLAWLWLAAGWTTAFLGLLTWALYVWVYTPLKFRTPQNTAVGAVAGALPVLIGWSAVAGINLEAAAMFMIVYLWQFPHFMAIAWLYRREYAAAGILMLPVVDPTGKRAASHAVSSALALVPVACLPGVLGTAGLEYFLGSVLLGLIQFAVACVFAVRRDETSARWLLRASLVYLPAVWLLLLWGQLG